MMIYLKLKIMIPVLNIILKNGYIHHNYKVMNATVARYTEEAFFIGKRTEKTIKAIQFMDYIKLLMAVIRKN